MDIQNAAKRELDRIREIVPTVKVLKPRGKDLIDFARNYAKDSEYFFKEKQFIEAFEAAIIAWAYVDIGFKIDMIMVPDYLRENFTK